MRTIHLGKGFELTHPDWVGEPSLEEMREMVMAALGVAAGPWIPVAEGPPKTDEKVLYLKNEGHVFVAWKEGFERLVEGGVTHWAELRKANQ